MSTWVQALTWTYKKPLTSAEPLTGLKMPAFGVFFFNFGFILSLMPGFAEHPERGVLGAIDGLKTGFQLFLYGIALITPFLIGYMLFVNQRLFYTSLQSSFKKAPSHYLVLIALAANVCFLGLAMWVIRTSWASLFTLQTLALAAWTFEICLLGICAFYLSMGVGHGGSLAALNLLPDSEKTRAQEEYQAAYERWQLDRVVQEVTSNQPTASRSEAPDSDQSPNASVVKTGRRRL